MLAQLLIRDFAIIDQTEMELAGGMTALTGETGAGKSILLDALGLVLGDRADTDSIRDGCSKAQITADFHPHAASPIWQWLHDHDLDQADACIIRRVISRDNRSRGYINGSPVSLQTLKTAGEMLVNIHGQHDHQSLTHSDYQRQILDNHAKNQRLLEKLYVAYKDWENANHRYEKIQSELNQRAQRVDMLRFQVQEFENLELDATELENIEKDHLRAANAGRLFDLAVTAGNALYEDEDSAYSLINRIEKNLKELNDLDDSTSEIMNMVNSASIQCSEAASSLKHYLDTINANPEKLQWLEQRLSSLHNLARKHQVSLEELIPVSASIHEELKELQNSDLTLESLDKQRLEKQAQYHKIADQLSKKRQTAARAMSKSITQTMQRLAMTGGVFEIKLCSKQNARPSINGQDEIQFLVSANPGQKPRELRKVVSGGELSRISLAIQLIVAEHQRVQTMIFDEVDSGVGGAVAETIGQNLRKLSASCQILCVTHLPQVASQAHNHYRVSKSTDGKKTQTQLIPLNKQETVEEIARMLGGKKISKQSQDHAAQMLASANIPT